jgi:hypothetical protein
VEEHLCAACKWLNVGRVLREDGNDFIRDRAFAADVGQRSDHVRGILDCLMLQKGASIRPLGIEACNHLTRVTKK